MRPSSLVVIVALALICLGASASTVFNLYTLSTPHQTSATVAPGSSLEFLVQMVTSDNVGGMGFDVVLPDEGWTLARHELSDYGWYENDGLWDTSEPSDPDTPVVIMNDTYGDAASDPDFHIFTAYDPVGTEVTGTVDVVSFTLDIPVATALGDYQLVLANPEAGSGIGSPYGDVSGGESFQLGIVPEPGTFALALMGLAGLALYRRRRRSV